MRLEPDAHRHDHVDRGLTDSTPTTRHVPRPAPARRPPRSVDAALGSTDATAGHAAARHRRGPAQPTPTPRRASTTGPSSSLATTPTPHVLWIVIPISLTTAATTASSSTPSPTSARLRPVRASRREVSAPRRSTIDDVAILAVLVSGSGYRARRTRAFPEISPGTDRSSAHPSARHGGVQVRAAAARYALQLRPRSRPQLHAGTMVEPRRDPRGRSRICWRSASSAR